MLAMWRIIVSKDKLNIQTVLKDFIQSIYNNYEYLDLL